MVLELFGAPEPTPNSFICVCIYICRLPGGSNGKESASNEGDRVWSLGQEDPLEKELETQSSIIA